MIAVQLLCNVLAPFFKMDGKLVARIDDHHFKSVDHLNPRVSYYNGWLGFITCTEYFFFFRNQHNMTYK